MNVAVLAKEIGNDIRFVLVEAVYAFMRVIGMRVQYLFCICHHRLG